ncbi:MAG: ABC transporter permease [Segniliparus sp.]|uniref:ABC transporter permease n=1 Tax=Segniliparus sp. TaxID=2804064 RepID=UPI003F2B1DB6
MTTAGTAGGFEFLRLVKSEWRKVRSLRFWWILLTAPLVITALSTVAGLAALAGVHGDKDSFHRYGSSLFSALTLMLGYAGFFAAGALTILFCGIFAGVNTAAEFQHRTITHTFTTARSRDRAILAKLLVTTLFGIGYGLVLDLVVVLATYLLGSFESSTLHRSTISASFVAGICLASVLVAVLWTWIGAGLGLLSGNPLSATVAQAFWSFPGEPLVWLILGFITLSSQGPGAASLARFLPVSATGQTLLGSAIMLDTSGPDQNTGITMLAYGPPSLAAWAVVLLGLGWWRARARDIT